MRSACFFLFACPTPSHPWRPSMRPQPTEPSCFRPFSSSSRFGRTGESGFSRTTLSMESNPFRRARFMLSAMICRTLPPDEGAKLPLLVPTPASPAHSMPLLITGRPAFVSKTSGRTQLINFFDLDDGRKLVDLPGYGYAMVPAAVKAPLAGCWSAYFGQRECRFAEWCSSWTRHCP